MNSLSPSPGDVCDRHLPLHLHVVSADQERPPRWRIRRCHFLPETKHRQASRHTGRFTLPLCSTDNMDCTVYKASSIVFLSDFFRVWNLVMSRVGVVFLEREVTLSLILYSRYRYVQSCIFAVWPSVKLRVALAQFRCSAHRLCVETGRYAYISRNRHCYPT